MALLSTYPLSPKLPSLNLSMHSSLLLPFACYSPALAPALPPSPSLSSLPLSPSLSMSDSACHTVPSPSPLSLPTACCPLPIPLSFAPSPFGSAVEGGDGG
ncbi:hypothetical protein AAC387_Pa02g1509 [Persea americana]